MKNVRWKQELIIRSRQKSMWGELLIILAYLSLTLFSTYSASRLAFHLSFSGVAIFAPLFVGGVLLLLKKDEFTMPLLLLLPAARLMFFLFSALISQVGADLILEQVALTLLGMTVFLLFLNYEHAAELFRRALTVFAFVVSIQIIACVIGLGSHFNKDNVLAGIGYSNYAATFLLIAVSFLLFRSVNRVEIVVLVLSIIALFLTMSSGAFIALFVVFCIWYRGKLVRNPKPFIILLVIALILLAVFGILSSQITFLYRLTRPIWSRFQLIFSGNFNGATSSRLTLYRYSLRSIGRHPFFGSIINYNDAFAAEEYNAYVFYRTHNLILESLLLYGIVGSLLNVGILAELVRRGRSIIKARPGRRILVLVFIVMALHGFVEPNFFTIMFEMFVWAIFGLFLSPYPAEYDSLPIRAKKKAAVGVLDECDAEQKAAETTDTKENDATDATDA